MGDQHGVGRAVDDFGRCVAECARHGVGDRRYDLRARAAMEDGGRNSKIPQHLRRILFAENGSDVADIHRGALHKVVLDRRWHALEGAGTEPELDHGLDRARLATAITLDIEIEGRFGDGEGGILSGDRKYFHGDRLEQDEPIDRHPSAERDGERHVGAEGMGRQPDRSVRPADRLFDGFGHVFRLHRRRRFPAIDLMARQRRGDNAEPVGQKIAHRLPRFAVRRRAVD